MQTSAWRDAAWWSGTTGSLDVATGLDPTAYTDSSFFDDERRQVFDRAWVCVGLADEIARTGRLLVRNLGERSIIITRDANETGAGDVHGFLNACRHRGTELAEVDCDIAHTIRCPYHRWGYATDGRLVATPRFEDIPRSDFDRADFGLIPVRVDTWGPLLFACLSDDTPDLLDWLGDLPERLAGYQLDTWTERASQTVEIDANWKLVTENFQEYYHLTWVHPELSKVSRVDDHYRYQGAGMYCGQTTTPVSGGDREAWLRMPAADGLDESDACSGRFVAIFPNVLLSVLPNHAFVMRLEPQSSGRTVETCSWLLPSPTGNVSDDEFAPTHDFWLDVNAQDVDIVERGQRGLTRGAVPAGPLAPRFEGPLHRFHNMLATCMTARSLASISIRTGDDPDDPSHLGTGPNPNPSAIDRK